MYRNPEAIFSPDIPVIQMSHSDFSVLDIDYEDEVAQGMHDKSYDFIYYMTNTEDEVKSDCTGWGSFAKNWPLAKEAMDIMCGEMDYRGIVMGIVDSHGNSCDLPPSCSDKVLKVQYANYFESLDYMRKSKFLLLPQVYDASPRVAVEAMSLNVPLLMNSEIIGGWKYINEQTGEFFRNDMSDFRSSLAKLMSNLDTYSPRSYVDTNYGSKRAGTKLRSFVEEYFTGRVTLPKSSRLLIPSEPFESEVKAHRLFSVFSSECSPFQDWQAQTLIHNHRMQGIQGSLVRLLACDDPHYVLPEHSYDKYRVVRTPNFGTRGDDDYRLVLNYWQPN